jgi:hypothetical protein
VIQHPSLINMLEPEEVFWLEMKDNYVIFSSSWASFYILNMNIGKIETMTELPWNQTGERYLGRNIVSWFLVLSYCSCFEIVDIKNATYLHSVSFDSGLRCLSFCANEFFYIASDRNKLVIYDFRSQLDRED